MRNRVCYLVGMAAALQVIGPAAAQSQSPNAPAGATAPRTAEALEELRILSIVNALQPSREQLTQLAVLAGTAQEGLAALDAEVKRTLEAQRASLLAAREALLQGAEPPAAAGAPLGSAAQSVEGARAQKTEALIATLAQRVRAMLTTEQVRILESELAPTGDQPWRLYARGSSGSSAPTTSGTRLPSDPGTWRQELRDLRARAAVGNPQAEVEAFSKKVTRGLRSATPLFDQAAAQARAVATQSLSLPAIAYSQREWTLARNVAKLRLEALNQQRSGDGKEIERFAADRWLVEQVLLSPRAAATLHDRAEVRP